MRSRQLGWPGLQRPLVPIGQPRHSWARLPGGRLACWNTEMVSGQQLRCLAGPAMSENDQRRVRQTRRGKTKCVGWLSCSIALRKSRSKGQLIILRS